MNVFKLMGALKDLPKIQAEVQAVHERLATTEFHGVSLDGAATATVNGTMVVLNVRFQRDIGSADGMGVAAASAVNDALDKARRATSEAVQEVLRDRLDMPELQGMLGNFLPR